MIDWDGRRNYYDGPRKLIPPFLRGSGVLNSQRGFGEWSSQQISEMLRGQPMIPVVVIEDPNHAVDTAKALMGGGMRVMEVVLRTKGALNAVDRIRSSIPGMSVGVGTVVEPDQARDAREAGAMFLVSPYATPRLYRAFEREGLPTIPGASNPQGVGEVLERGYKRVKLYPWEGMIKPVLDVLPQAELLPTGGLNLERAKQLMVNFRVDVVGGSWVTGGYVETQNWAMIERRARDAMTLGIITANRRP